MRKLKDLFYFVVFVFVFVVVPYKYLVPKYEYFISESEFKCQLRQDTMCGHWSRLPPGQIVRFNRYTGEFRIIEPDYKDYYQIHNWGKK